MNNSVAALVVTYNRKELLLRCIKSILNQDALVDKIFIIDNASTDGTDKLFLSNYTIDERIVYKRMPTNLGGAGGFKEGLKIVTEANYDWVWLMDDDCIPYLNTLSNLINKLSSLEKNVSFLASSVFGPDNEPMNVPIIHSKRSSNGYPYWYMHLDNGLVEIQSATFVSLLIRCKAICAVGLPIGSFFIWGDDAEYTNRLTRYYGPAYMVGTSKVLHNRLGAHALDIFYEDNKKRISNYKFHYRNNLIVAKYYQGNSAAIKLCFRYFSTCFRILFSKHTQYRFSKIFAISKGCFNFIFNLYDIEDLRRLIKKD